MSWQLPSADITPEKVEQRSGYMLVTTDQGDMYGDWREGKSSEGDYPLEIGKTYGIEYSVSKDGKYKNIKLAYIKED